MIDLHSHILYGIDDGSKSLGESLEMLELAEKEGVKDIVLTPHYVKDSIYNTNNKDKKKIFNALKKEVEFCGIGVNIYLGNEVYIDEDIDKLLSKEILTINNSRYLLMELPLNRKSIVIEEAIAKLQEKDIVPIIAHPERYLCYYKDYNFFRDLVDSGCLLQANVGSLFGKYGRKSKKILKELLKRDLISFFGSDIHSTENNFYKLDVRKKLIKMLRDEGKVDDLLVNNALKVLNNEKLY